MSNSDELTRALAKNGAYDRDKAEEMRTKMIENFRATMRKAERALWGRSCLYALLGVFAATHFIHGSGTKTLIFYGLLTLVFFNCLLQMKTWFSIAYYRTSVLKAITQLELSGQASVGADTIREHQELQLPFVDGVPKWERRIWWSAIIGGCLLILFVKGIESQGVADPWDLDSLSSLTSQGCVRLAPDGSGSEVTEISSLQTGVVRRSRFSFDAPDGAVLQFTDHDGNELPVTTSPNNGHVCHNVRLLHPVMAGRRLSYTRRLDYAESATEKEGVWTHSGDSSYSFNTNEFTQTVVLPEGAEIVSVEPWPVAKFTLNNKPTVRFEGTRGYNDPFTYTVQYRLAGEGSD